MRNSKLTKVLSWYYVFAFIAIVGLGAYLYSSFIIREGANSSKFRKNENVEVLWEGIYYKGKVTGINREDDGTNTYEIKYDEDGSEGSYILEESIRKIPKKAPVKAPVKAPTSEESRRVDKAFDDIERKLDEEWFKDPGADFKGSTLSDISKRKPITVSSEENILKNYPGLRGCRKLRIEKDMLNGDCRWYGVWAENPPINIMNCDREINNCAVGFTCGPCPPPKQSSLQGTVNVAGASDTSKQYTVSYGSIDDSYLAPTLPPGISTGQSFSG
jgi:hypothetical protein